MAKIEAKKKVVEKQPEKQPEKVATKKKPDPTSAREFSRGSNEQQAD